MGIGNIGWFQILVILLIVLLIFGTRRIRTLGSDLGGAIREFRKGVSDDEPGDQSTSQRTTDSDSSERSASGKSD
ncbi:MAG: twin-arginine translocase TatA/TatE family subunit [Pseudomonadota bacterium]|nr:MAG: twin-arginine translocase TatA/TatE family subunit [Pseudomonadota bacterium]